MFGEDESESPRVPSPWDSLMSTPASTSPSSYPVLSSSPSATVIPKLVPESDDGNVEYKLQLLNPSATRFARLVTQMKWRLLEGGGQAYYELGVADSGFLVGLNRADLECSLQTLETMAGDIGASVIIVKEIEVPAAMAEIAAAQEDRNARRRGYSTDGATSTATETEGELSTTDIDDDNLVMHFQDSSVSSVAIFTMDPEPDPGDNTDTEDPRPQFSIDLEISSVFKPRPTRTRISSSNNPLSDQKRTKGPKPRKLKHVPDNNRTDEEQQRYGKSHNRRQARDKRREEKRRKALVNATSNALADAAPANQSTDAAESLVSGLEALHVSVEEPPVLTVDDAIPTINLSPPPGQSEVEDAEVVDEEDDVFPSPTPSAPYAPFKHSTEDPVTPLQDGLLAPSITVNTEGEKKDGRFIVEVLVVRKLSLEEAFLDFGGFALEL